ncbi:MAG: DEAD/DEAH box helicase [Myxococcales bacterium]|nr:DEAD/DEAH box helicase [Myxococcales bacterium]
MLPSGPHHSAAASRLYNHELDDELESWSEPAERARLVRPVLKVFHGPLCVDRGFGLGSEFHEVEAPLLALSFEYDAFTIAASDPRTRVFSSHGVGMAALERDPEGEHRARMVLESLGAIELEALEDHAVPPGCAADYLLHVDSDRHSRCAFTAHGLPQLEALGWRVEVDASYPYQVLGEAPPWYAVLEPAAGFEPEAGADATPDWFSLELGVEVGGHRINLLPALLEMLDDDGRERDLLSLHGRAPRYVELPGGGRYVEVPPERFRTLLRVVAELYQGEDGPEAHFPLPRLSALAELDETFQLPGPPLRIEGAEGARRRARALLTDDGAEPASSENSQLQATLRPYQEEALRWLARLRGADCGGVLADDMGLGKTLQTIAHLCNEHAAGRLLRPSLIVCPTSLVGNWARELERFAPHLRVMRYAGRERKALRDRMDGAQVVITSYPVLVRDEDFLLLQSFYYVILDEAQTIKNPRSRATRLCKALTSEQRLCLSGTPIENNLLELWSLFDFINPGLLGSEQQFRHFFASPIEQGRDELRLAALRAQITPYVLRRMKEEVARELPPKTELRRPVELEGPQRELYESIRVAAHSQVRSAIRKRGIGASAITIVDALMRLRQLCCDPRLVRGQAARGVSRSAKYEMLFELLEDQLPRGRRVLIFSQFTSMLALIAQGLEQRGLGYVSLTGSSNHRDRIVASFEGGDVDVFLISLKAGGTGLNLVSADTVVHYDPWWNPAAQDQATDRAYRIGQKKPVFVHNLIVAGSVEERMLALQQRKRHLARSLIGGGSQVMGALEEAEIEHLLAPLDP